MVHGHDSTQPRRKGPRAQHTGREEKEGTRHTEGTSVYSPNRPTWVSIRERSSSCVWGGHGGLGWHCQGSLLLSLTQHTRTHNVHTLTHIHTHARMHTRAKAADLYVAHRWVWGFLWPVWELLVACGLCIEQVGQRAQLEMVTI